MSTWVNESCRFHLINTLPFLALRNRHAGPGAVHTAERCWELGTGWGRLASVGQSGESPAGAGKGLPLGSSAEIPVNAPFLQGRLRVTQAPGALQRCSHFPPPSDCPLGEALGGWH